MAGMDLDAILQDLERRFSAPLPDFYRRRIIFWHDEERQFADRLDEIHLPNVKLAVMTGSNSFAVKKLLSVDDRDSDYLVYCPLVYQDPEDNWLLNMELYSGEPFRADLTSVWMDELSIPQAPRLREVVKRYQTFFNNKERRAKLAAVKGELDTPMGLLLGMMAVQCGVRKGTFDAVLRAVLSAGLEKESNPAHQNMVRYGTDGVFWNMVRQGAGYGEETPSLARLAAHLLLTAATLTLGQGALAGLDDLIDIPHQAFCYDFVSEWLHSEQADKLKEIACIVETEMRLPQRFMGLELEDIVGTECFPCVNECILYKLMTEIGNNIIEAETIAATVEKRRSCAWYGDVKHYFDALLRVANMQTFFMAHSDGFHTVEPQNVWRAYTDEYYQMDTYYRQFHLAYGESLKLYNEALTELMNHVKDRVEGLYVTWFLGNLSGQWTGICEEHLAEYGYVLDIPRQENFYREWVRKADSRVFVVISDALRYEVAASLADQLRRETQSQVRLGSCQGLFPTVTPFGMAALLPHKELSVECRGDRVAVLADGMSTGSGDRDRVLKSAEPSGVALQYKSIIGMKRQERSALVKGKEVIYIYHDAIDEASHTADSMVFPACDDAIDQLKNLVRIIVNEFGGTNILITADHGFLYTYSPLTEDDKVGRESFNGREVECGRRYVITEKGAAPEYLMPVKLLGGTADLDAFTPRENIRIKMKGGGMNYVHGGVSLQEMVVPIIEYHYLRNESKEYQRNRSRYDTKPVTLSLLSSSRKISNMIFSLNFYQDEPVGANREGCTYRIYLTDSYGKKISDEQRVFADKTSLDNQERIFRCNFNLKPARYDNKAIYYLVIESESGVPKPVQIEFHIDIAFAVDDFNFFG